ncbi:MAG: nucleoside diphosphate kinase regulator [Deltaproteobacteria bacterium]|nr:nucleoside diphosphate kinase regulator [Deltaproteobacteria bacterium]
MSERTIYVTRFDMDRLMDLIEGLSEKPGKKKASIEMLERELSRGKVVEPKDIPPDVITMNSTVHVTDLDSGEKMLCSLVFPSRANIDENRISILAPLGVALIGYRVGDVIEWEMPSGKKRLNVDEIIYQPEAAGDYHL